MTRRSPASRPADHERDRQVGAVRHFNRFYTRRIGVLQRGFLHSPFSLAQVRLLYELAHAEDPTAADLGKALGLDSGYLSRMLRSLEKRGLLERRRSERDGRRHHLSLTGAGQDAFATLDQRQGHEVSAMLEEVAPAVRHELVDAMAVIERALGDHREPSVPYLLRPPHPGDMGWVVHRHGVLYAREYGYDEEFEALVASIVATFVQRFKAKRERCWIAEREGVAVGSVFLVEKSKTAAQLRLLLVEPAARGLGIGQRLVEECIRFACAAGYTKLVLWTQSELTAARHLYERAGFRLREKQRHHSFGKRLVAETWELPLSGGRP